MRKNWFYKLLFSYLPVFLIISLSLLLMTYLTLTEMSKRSAIQAHQALSQNVMKLIDHTLDGVNSLMINEILNNDNLKLFFDDKTVEHRQYGDIAAAGALKKLLVNNPLIESIYLYRGPDRTVLTPSILTHLEAFADRQFIGLTLNSRVAYKWTVRTVSPQEGSLKQGMRVVSLAKNTNLSNFSIMVVNIKVEHLRELMESMINKNMTFVNLTDGTGKLIVSSEADAEIDSSVLRTGRILSSAGSEYTDWTISSGSRKGGIVEIVSSLFYVWMAIAFLIILAGLAWIIYVSRRNYKPLQALMNRISDVRQTTHPTASAQRIDEFKFIETTIEDLLDESNMLQEQYKETSIYHKRHIFLNLLEGNQGNQRKNWEEEFKHLGLNASVNAALVALIEIDHYAEFAVQYERDQHLLKYVLSNVIKEITENQSFIVWTEWINSYQMAVLFLIQNQKEGEREVTGCCEILRVWVENNLDFTITIGIGQQRDGWEYISESFREAVTNVGYKSSFGTNRTITPAHVISRPKGELFKQLQCIRSLSQAFRAGDREWETYYLEIFESLQDQLYSQDDLSNLMQVLIGHLQKEMAELPKELYEIWSSEVHSALLETLRQEETQNEVYTKFHQILQNAQAKMDDLRESKSTHQLVNNVKCFIHDNYQNPDLSLMHLSEEFGLNAKYLSRLFREAFGVKFVEYITAIRMENAEQLLVKTEEAIQDIAHSVGYEQSLTFIRVFKKHTGETPGQYRKLKS